MLSRLLYMIPFFGMVIGSFFIWTADIRAALIMAGLALTQSLICFLYLVLQRSLSETFSIILSIYKSIIISIIVELK